MLVDDPSSKNMPGLCTAMGDECGAGDLQDLQ